MKSQAIRFILVGVLNTLFGYFLFSLFLFLGFPEHWATLFAICLGLIFNFQSIGLLVFKNRNQRLFFKYLAVYGVIYFSSVLLLRLGTYLLPTTNRYLIGFFTFVSLAPLSFLLQKYWVFKERKLS